LTTYKNSLILEKTYEFWSPFLWKSEILKQHIFTLASVIFLPRQICAAQIRFNGLIATVKPKSGSLRSGLPDFLFLNCGLKQNSRSKKERA